MFGGVDKIRIARTILTGCGPVDIRLLRPFNTFGLWQNERAIIGAIIRQALNPSCSTIMFGDATTVRDLTSVTKYCGGIHGCRAVGKPGIRAAI
jgi:nucleoside-diphosphate-sugar epimerase